MKELIEAIERYGFECEGGRLEDCLDWQELKRKVLGSNLMDKNPLMAHIAHCSDPACPICQPVTTQEEWKRQGTITGRLNIPKGE